ncbi:DUF488 domain-containing protein [Leifsonia sp. F6_8S_P_1B]|uniref:DUF488 domain-containing protein n=1 Tax=Leifsonia williamsii TaxID=3035919 RepID=A0ABT8KAC7_9MICO|nr:DUF488 domain-containing protein [Leifsonia williamsii]MDN4614409.1 DUF488 domain-containing protein [Leifsonia williamsii]
MTTVHTIGHSTRTVAEVADLLRENGVTRLVDVRRFPGSRRLPQWGREAVEAALPADIDYRWLPALGGRRHTPAGTPTVNEGWRVKAFRDYADYMATHAFRDGLDELWRLAEERPAAIMCSEALPWRCHRRLITDALIVRGAEVVDILGPHSTRPAELTTFARQEGGTLTYPAAAVAQG